METSFQMPIELELQKLGLNKNEALTYLALLELGQSSAQTVSKKTRLSRPTTYRILDILEKKGLAKHSTKDRQLFSAESPDEILGMLRSKKRRIEEQEREFVRIISLLKSKYDSSHKNEIRFYSGAEGQKFLLEEFSATHAKDILVIFASAKDPKIKEFESLYRSIRKRLGKVRVREIYPQIAPESNLDFIERKVVENLNFSGTMVLADKILFFENGQSFSLEEKTVIELMRILLNAIWKK